MPKISFSRIIDYLILSFLVAAVFCMGYVFTAATMVILYAVVYAFLIDGEEVF